MEAITCTYRGPIKIGDIKTYIWVCFGVAFQPRQHWVVSVKYWYSMNSCQFYFQLGHWAETIFGVSLECTMHLIKTDQLFDFWYRLECPTWIFTYSLHSFTISFQATLNWISLSTPLFQKPLHDCCRSYELLMVMRAISRALATLKLKLYISLSLRDNSAQVLVIKEATYMWTHNL